VADMNDEGRTNARRWPAAIELSLVLLCLTLRAVGAIRNPSLLILAIGWLSLWKRRVGWRGVGLRRPASWRRTLVIGIGVGIVYDAADVFAILPVLGRLTGQAVRVDQLGDLHGNPGGLLLWIALTWSFGALAEELAYRGYVLNRIGDLLGRTRIADAASAVVASALFGFAHGAQGAAGVLDNVLAGILFSALYVASGRNLWLPIVVHGVVDTTSVALLFLGVSPR